jgi:hypothetical protein
MNLNNKTILISFTKKTNEINKYLYWNFKNDFFSIKKFRLFYKWSDKIYKNKIVGTISLLDFMVSLKMMWSIFSEHLSTT